MSGHSKWHNIQAKKSKTDAARAKVFTKIGKEMMIAIREGGANPDSNSKLAALIAKAKANNVPNDNIDRLIKKASGADAVEYEEITYEGYGPSGVAIIVETATDNRNRTAGSVRHYFDKFHGNLGQSGCVGFMFSQCGVISISNEDGDIDADKLMEDALEAGASDFIDDGEVFEIRTEPDDLDAVRDALSAKGYTFLEADLAKIPSTYVKLDNEEDIKYMGLLLDALEEDDDVQDVWHNWEEE